MTVTQFSSVSDRFGQPDRWLWRGWQIHYTYQPTLAATAAPVLLLHGFGASLGHWRHNIAALSVARSVYALDLLGFGGSQKPELPYTIDLWVEQIHDFWQERIQQPILLVGHSIGGLIALLATAKYPEMVKGLCLISCADGPHLEDLPAFLRPLVGGLFSAVVNVLGFPLTYPYLFRWLRETEVLRGWIRNVYKQDQMVDDELVTIFQQPAFDQGAEHVFLDAFRAVLTRPFGNPKHLLPQIHTPILLIWGQQDPAVPSFLADQFKRWQPDIMLVKLPNVGHCAHDELPGWVNALISEWASSLEVVQDPWMLRGWQRHI